MRALSMTLRRRVCASLLGGSICLSTIGPDQVWAGDPPPSAPGEKAAPTVLAPQSPDSAVPGTAVPPADSSGSEWIDLDGLGIRIQPPQPALGKSETVEGVLRYEIVEGVKEPRWWLRFQSLLSSRPEQTAKDQIADYVEVLTKNGRQFTVKVDEPLKPTGATGEGRLFIIESPISDTATGMSGWAIVPTGPDRFVTCSIIATTADFASIYPAIREALGTMTVTPTAQIDAARKERIALGESMLRFDKQAMRRALREEPLIYRMYRPGTRGDGSDEIELGWMTVRSIEGMRGEVDSARKPDSLKSDDLEKGLLVIMQAQWIIDNDPTNMIDVEARNWSGWDRMSEVWSIRSTQRQKSATRTEGETGVRTAPRAGDPRPILRVFQSVAEKRTREPMEWQVPPNYLSQAELLVIGRLLPKNDAAPPTFASYAFDPKSRGLPQRLETWKRNADGTWILESRIGGSTVPLVQTFDAAGDRLRRVDIDATGTIITERSTIEALRSLWTRKGLPIE